MVRYLSFFLTALCALLLGIPQVPITAVFEPAGWRVGEAMAQSVPTNAITITNQSGAVLTNYPLQFGRPFLAGAIPGQPQVLINGNPAPTQQADVKNRYPDGSVKFAVLAVVIPTIPATGALTLTFQNQAPAPGTPLTASQMLDPSYNFVAFMTLKSPTAGVTKTVSAKQMLQNGDYRLWTAGPVAQTIILGDDSASRKYDIGFGDGYRPLRPRFHATFWPSTRQISLRVAVENGLTTELEDMGYTVSIRVGAVAPGGTSSAAGSYFADLTGTQASNPRLHWALSAWTKVFWLGGTPEPRVNIDYNLGYLTSTRFIANYDPGVTIPESTIASTYGFYTTAAHDDVFDSDIYTTQMSSVGGREELGPYPAWNITWLYTGDWRMRQMSLGLADLAAAWPMNLRETASGKRLSRYDPAGSSTGLGHTASITDRQGVSNPTQYLLFYNPVPSSQQLTLVGPIDGNPPWAYSGAHEPSPFYIPYLLTGDPWYLEELYNWAGFAAFSGNGTATVYNFGRGPTGAEGGISDETRGLGWVLRSRAETAFIAPDADPEKAYFTYLVNDALARWEGVAITLPARPIRPPRRCRAAR